MDASLLYDDAQYVRPGELDGHPFAARDLAGRPSGRIDPDIEPLRLGGAETGQQKRSKRRDCYLRNLATNALSTTIAVTAKRLCQAQALRKRGFRPEASGCRRVTRGLGSRHGSRAPS